MKSAEKLRERYNHLLKSWELIVDHLIEEKLAGRLSDEQFEKLKACAIDLYLGTDASAPNIHSLAVTADEMLDERAKRQPS